MEEDEYDDELPPISVNCSSKEVSVFSMPSAEVLASQRAREEECERELREMRERHERHEAALAAVANGVPTLPSRSDSSSSEGETALTSAVEVHNTNFIYHALRVDNSPVIGVQRPTATELLDSMLAQLPPSARAFCQDYRDALQRCSAREIDSLTDDLITAIGSWLCGFDVETAKLECSGEESADVTPETSPSDDEVLSVCACLLAAALCRRPASQRARARRALHALLAAASDAQVNKVCMMLVLAVRCPRWRLELSGALSAAGRAAQPARVAATLARAALTDLLRGNTEEADNASDACNLGPLTLQELAELARRGWRSVAESQREVTLVLLGRALHAAKLCSKEQERLHAGQDGLKAPPTGQDGSQMAPAGQDGSQMAPAGQDGSQMELAGQDGSQMEQAGQDGSQMASAGLNGLQMAAADRNELAMDTCQDGLQAMDTCQDESLAAGAGQNGSQAIRAGQDGSLRTAAGQDGSQAALEAALAALAQPLAATPQDRHQPHHLKIAVAASKLQILLSDRN